MRLARQENIFANMNLTELWSLQIRLCQNCSLKIQHHTIHWLRYTSSFTNVESCFFSALLQKNLLLSAIFCSPCRSSTISISLNASSTLSYRFLHLKRPSVYWMETNNLSIVVIQFTATKHNSFIALKQHFYGHISTTSFLITTTYKVPNFPPQRTLMYRIYPSAHRFFLGIKTESIASRLLTFHKRRKVRLGHVEEGEQ